jgi:cytoskeleton protein RodZ
LFLVWFWQTHMLNEQPVSMLPELETAAPAVAETEPTTSSGLPSQSQPVLIVANEPAGLDPAAQTTDAPSLPSATSNAGTSALTAAAPTNEVATVADGAVDSQPAAIPNTAVIETTPPTGGQTVPATAALTQPSVTASATPVQTITEPVQQTSPASDAAVAQSVPSNTPQAGSTEIQLQLQFSAQCWVAVIAADGKRLAYSMQNSGQTLTLKGMAPLKVTLGDPAAVTASLNGNSIDLSGYKQGQVTRLTLTGSE